jgi:hypothetical protein
MNARDLRFRTPKMTHAHFALIAEVMRDAAYGLNDIGERVFPTSGQEMHADIVGRFTDALAATNPRFNRARFLAACGVEEPA